MSRFTVRIEGLDALQRQAAADTLLAAPLRRFFTAATLAAQAAAQMKTPVATGTLRRSETTAVDPAPLPLWGQVGTNVPYGVYVHEGTRRMPPRPFFRDGIAAAMPKITALLDQAGAEIAARWGG